MPTDGGDASVAVRTATFGTVNQVHLSCMEICDQNCNGFIDEILSVICCQETFNLVNSICSLLSDRGIYNPTVYRIICKVGV